MTNRRARPAWCGVGILVCLVFLTATALADSDARIVRLSYAEGDVRLDRGDGRGFEQGLMNMPVAHGNRVWTRNEALAEVEFEDGDTIRLTPETLVILHNLALRSNGVRISVVELQEGEAYFHLRHNDDNDFRILLPGRELELRKSSHLRLAVHGQQVELAVIKGEVEIRGQNERLLVKKGETLTLDPNDADRYYLARSVQESSYDQWDKDRDHYRDRYASSSSYGGYSPYYSYGVSDLNYYGGYFNYPGYGLLWRPSYVGYGWSPFDNGAWVFYPGYGYVWVSAYPWGWIPYRYGSWYYINGHGWCWRRGNNWNRWSSFTRVHHAPRHFQAPVAPQNKNGGIVNVGSGAQPIFPGHDPGDPGAPSRRVFNVAGDEVSRGSKGMRGREGITPYRPADARGDDAVSSAGKSTSDRGGITPFRPANTAGNDDATRAGKGVREREGITPFRPADAAGDDTATPAGKGTRDREGITPYRLPAAGDPDSEVVGKRSTGQPIVFPSRNTSSSDDHQPQARDSYGGMGRSFRDSTAGDSGSRSADRSDDQPRGRVMDSDRSPSSGKSYSPAAPQSGIHGSQWQSTPRGESSGSSSSVRASSPSRSHDSGSSSPARSYSSGSASSSGGSGGNSGGGGRSSGNSGAGSSRSNSSGSGSKSTTR